MTIAQRPATADPMHPAYATLAATVQYRAGQVDQALETLEKYLPLLGSCKMAAPAERDAINASRLVGETTLMMIQRDREEPDILTQQAATVRDLVRQLKSTGPYYCDEAQSWRVAFAVLFAERELARLGP
jgi:hypothetical protein